MNSLRRMTRHPARTLEDLSDEIVHHTRAMAKRPYSTGGLVVLILSIIGFIWLFPELRRYVRIDRM
jgi:hypothetical protein